MTLYDVRLKKNLKQQVVRSHTVTYSEFNNLFGIKKHELDRSQLILFATHYLETLKLHMPTMAANKGDDEDSEYEELIKISQSKLITIANCRKFLKCSHFISGQPTVAIVTIQLLTIEGSEKFFGVKVSKLNREDLSEAGFFLFVDTSAWEMTAQEKKLHAPEKMNLRRTVLDSLTYHYKLVHMLQKQGGFD